MLGHILNHTLSPLNNEANDIQMENAIITYGILNIILGRAWEAEQRDLLRVQGVRGSSKNPYQKFEQTFEKGLETTPQSL